MKCNYWYGGTNLIDMSQSRIVCGCGLDVRYEGKLDFYNPPGQPNLKELIAELRLKHFQIVVYDDKGEICLLN